MNTQAVARALHGEAIGRSRVLCPGPGHSVRDRSLSVLFDPYAPDGFLVESFAGDDFRECRDHVRAALGLGEWRATEPRSRPLTQPVVTRAQAPSAPDQVAKAKALWRRSVVPDNSPVARYLRARGYDGRLPLTIRYLPASKPEHHPAMIAALSVATENEPGELTVRADDVCGVHLTLLREDGNGKAGTDKDKIMVGRCLGSPIVLAAPNDLLGLAITEGIEDGLSIHEATGLGVWAAGSAGFMPALSDIVPDYIETVTICAHEDVAGLTGAHGLADYLAARGIETTVLRLPSGAAS